MKYSEIFKLAYNSIKSNLLRSVLTLSIIAFGIMALVGILTALDAVIYSMSENFSGMGANSFSIQRKYAEARGRGRRAKIGETIDFKQAAMFKEQFVFPAKIALSYPASNNSILKTENKKTNPTIRTIGIDENYIDVNGYSLAKGRNLTEGEVASGMPYVIIGTEIVGLLFDKNVDKALNADLFVGNIKYKILGILASKGSSFGSSGDRIAMIPLQNTRKYYDNGKRDYDITVGLTSAADMDNASQLAQSLFHNIRGIKLGTEDDFEISKSDGLIEIIKENTVTIRMATIAIGLITLLGASIGLMNIMLVSVTERTREIGITKALGATRKTILIQFLTEAVIIGQLGGIVGIILGILIGNIVTLILGGSFLIPWAWILLGVVTCLIVGLFSGLYPALKASKLDPIEALRYE
jgi:putative ABC transport system permease protein